MAAPAPGFRRMTDARPRKTRGPGYQTPETQTGPSALAEEPAEVPDAPPFAAG